MAINNLSWSKEKAKINAEAIRTPNRLDDSVYRRAKTVKPIFQQKLKDPKVNISDAMFNKVPGIGPGATVSYNKARMKLFGLNIKKVDKFVGKRNNLDHI